MPLEQASPKELGFDADRLALVEEAIARDIEAAVYDGAALAVGRHGSLALFSVQGFAHRETGRALKEDDVFVSFSSGKQFTVAAVLRFVERGLLQLHQPVADVIPEFAQNGKGKISLQQLLTHTSGIVPFPPPLPPEDAFDLEKVVGAICRSAPETLAGNAVRYSVLCGHAVMAEMVRRVDGGGRPFRQIVHDEVFAPLAMDDTALGVPDRLRERLCPVVVRDRSPGLLDPDMVEGLGNSLGPASEVPAGGYVTTVNDFARFAEALRGGGALDGHRVLSPLTLDLATRNYTGRMPNDLWNYAVEARGWPIFPAYLGLGFFLRGKGLHPTPFGSLATPRTYGGVGAGSTAFFVDPERDLFYAFLSTGLLEESRSTERHQRLADLVHAAIVD
jgi:CubicO group peptidase (beta-lactamase class C family)